MFTHSRHLLYAKKECKKYKWCPFHHSARTVQTCSCNALGIVPQRVYALVLGQAWIFEKNYWLEEHDWKKIKPVQQELSETDSSVISILSLTCPLELMEVRVPFSINVGGVPFCDPIVPVNLLSKGNTLQATNNERQCHPIMILIITMIKALNILR